MQRSVPLSSAYPLGRPAPADPVSDDGAAERLAIRREAERLAESYGELPLPGVSRRALVERIERDLIARRLPGARRG